MTSIFRDFIPIQVFRVSELLQYKINSFLERLITLEEAYVEPKINKRDIECSLQSIKIDLDDENKETILDDLNNEFLCLGILFFEDDGRYGKIIPSYPKEGIVYGDYNPQTRFMEICINDTFFSNFLDDNFELLSNGLMGIITHEDTHNQQIDHSKGKVKSISSDINLHTMTGMKDYLSHYTEIDAHARETAIYLYNNGYDGSQIKQMINQCIQNKKPNRQLNDCSSFMKMWNYIGQVACAEIDSKKNPKEYKVKIDCFHTWRRFLTRLMYYLTSTLRYAHKLGDYKYQMKNLSKYEKELKNKQGLD